MFWFEQVKNIIRTLWIVDFDSQVSMYLNFQIIPGKIDQ